MADISKVKINSNIYNIKDTEARSEAATANTTITQLIMPIIQSIQDPLLFKGVIGSSAELSALTNQSVGYCYKVSDRFYDESIGWVEVGDMIICQSISNGAPTWTVIQSNTDIYIGSSASTNGTSGLVPAPGTTDVNKFLKGSGQWTSITTDYVEEGLNDLILNCGTSTINV